MATRASAIIPAYNEAARITAVIRPLLGSGSVHEVIVVDDNSTDGTAEAAQKWGVTVIRLTRNVGKAAALDHGVQAASSDLLLFLDADLVGLLSSHIDAMIQMYESKRLDMLVGVFKNGRLNTDLAQTISPHLSGQRVLRKHHWNRLRELGKLEFGVEMALTKLSIKEDWAEERLMLEGVTHVMKEEKRGFSQGLIERIHMYGDILRSLFTRVS